MNATLRPGNRVIHADFRAAYKSQEGRALALLVDCSRFQLSRWMNKPISPTPSVVSQLAQVAAVLDYTGALFADEESR